MAVLGLELVSWRLEDKPCSRTLNCDSSGLTRAKFGRRNLCPESGILESLVNVWFGAWLWDFSTLKAVFLPLRQALLNMCRSLVAATVETTIFSINFFSAVDICVCGCISMLLSICPRMVPYLLRQTWNTIFSYPITWCSVLHRHSLGHFLGSLMNYAHLDSSEG